MYPLVVKKHYNIRNVESPPARCLESECSHFWLTCPSFWEYLSAVEISLWYLEQFKSWYVDKHPRQHIKLQMDATWKHTTVLR